MLKMGFVPGEPLGRAGRVTRDKGRLYPVLPEKNVTEKIIWAGLGWIPPIEDEEMERRRERRDRRAQFFTAGKVTIRMINFVHARKRGVKGKKDAKENREEEVRQKLAAVRMA